jgi:choline dehydrogenase-like flavoprotein
VSTDHGEAYDYVVVGGGSAGCIAAARLAEDPARRVLLLEAGPPAEAHPETLSADGYKHAFINDKVIWERFTTPQAHAGDQRIFAGTGTVLGGSGSVNGMVYTRGDTRDYDEWPRGLAVERRTARLRAHRGHAAPAPAPAHALDGGLHLGRRLAAGSAAAPTSTTATSATRSATRRWPSRATAGAARTWRS